MSSVNHTKIDRGTRPTFKESFWFPIATREAQRDLIVGGTSLIIPPLGWVLNMGHRLDVVYRIYHDEPPYYQGFKPYGSTFLRGLKAAVAILVYLSPSLICGSLAYSNQLIALWVIAALLFITKSIHRKLLGTSAQIDVYEKTDRIGGRLDVITLNGQTIESGGTIIHSSNKYMVEFTKEMGMYINPVGEVSKTCTC